MHLILSELIIYEYIIMTQQTNQIFFINKKLYI